MHRFKHRPEGRTQASQESLTRIHSSSSTTLSKTQKRRRRHPHPHPPYPVFDPTADKIYTTTTTTLDDAAVATTKHTHAHTSSSDITTSTCLDIPGHRTQRAMGTVYGTSVRSRGTLLLPAAVGASLKTLAGGEVSAVTKLLHRTRTEALSRLTAESRRRGANAVLGLRLDTAHLPDGMVQVSAYGTAVYVVEEGSGANANADAGPGMTATTATATATPLAELTEEEDQGVLVGAGVCSMCSLDMIEEGG